MSASYVIATPFAGGARCAVVCSGVEDIGLYEWNDRTRHLSQGTGRQVRILALSQGGVCALMSYAFERFPLASRYAMWDFSPIEGGDLAASFCSADDSRISAKRVSFSESEHPFRPFLLISRQHPLAAFSCRFRSSRALPHSMDVGCGGQSTRRSLQQAPTGRLSQPAP